MTVYSRVLLGLGYRVLIACDGKTGLFAAESCNPSIILLDMLMSDMDGVEAQRRSKQTPSTEENMEKRVQEVFENLNQEIESLEAHARRVEALLPHLPPNARQQWTATATARLAYEEELRKLLNVVLGKE